MQPFRQWIGERRLWALALAVGAAAAVLVPSACGSSSEGSGASDPQDGAATPADARVPPTTPNDAGPDASAALPSLDALMADDSIWTKLADPGSCSLREAKVVPDPFPQRVWSSCGPGCRVTSSTPAFKEPTDSVLSASAGYVDGEVFLLMPLDGANGRIVRIERLSDGATIAAVLDRGVHRDTSCYQAWGGSAPFLFTIGGGHQIRFGRAPHQPGGPIVWHDKWLKIDVDLPLYATERFDFDLGYGIGTDGTPILFSGPSAAVGFDLAGSGHVAHGLGNQLVWGGTTASIRSYAQDGGSVDLVPLTGVRRIRKLRLTTERMVWISATPVGGAFKDAQWQWSPRTTDPSSIVIHDGPAIPNIIADGGTDMMTAGDWAATVGSDGMLDRIYVWRISTGETWVLPNRAGFQFRRILAVSPTELILGEQSAAHDNSDLLDTLMRVDLTMLPALVAAFAK